MKKFTLPILVTLSVMLFVLYSCNKETDKPVTTQKENVTTNNTPKDSTPPKEKTPEAKEVKLIPDEQKKLNTFFSNFSEAGLKPFTSGNISDDELINFGVLHNYRNNFKLFEKVDDATLQIKGEFISKSIKKYFDRDFKNHKPTNEYKYKNGYYFVPNADGEAYTFSQVERLTDIGGDKYIAYINVYTASSGWTGNQHGSPKSWGSGEDKPELSGKYKATFKKTNGSNGENVNTLIDYIKQ